MAREGSKRGIAIALINEMKTAPASEVIAAIAVANDLKEANARSYFSWIVKNGYAVHEGAPLEVKRGRPASESKPAKVKAPKVAKAPKVPESTESTDETLKGQAAAFLAWREKQVEKEEAPAEDEVVPEVLGLDGMFGDDVQGVPDFIPDSLRAEYAQGAQAD